MVHEVQYVCLRPIHTHGVHLKIAGRQFVSQGSSIPAF